MADRRNSPGRDEILAVDGAPSVRDLDYWVRKGYLRPVIQARGTRRSVWTWPLAEQRVAVTMGRLVTAGLRPDAAERIARLRVEGFAGNGQPVTAFERLIAAGLEPDAAERAARHPTGGPVVLAPGVIISLFPLPGTAVGAVA